MKHAAKTIFYKSGNRSLGDVLEVATSTPKRAIKIKIIKISHLLIKKSSRFIRQRKVLGFFLNNKLNKQQYIYTRFEAKN